MKIGTMMPQEGKVVNMNPRLVTVDTRSRLTLGATIAPPCTTYRVVKADNGTITLIPVVMLDAQPDPE